MYKKDESVLFFYKEIYPFFIRLFINRNTEFVVQQEFIKKLLSDKFNINSDKIHVIVPNLNLSFETKKKKINLQKNKYHLFYPTNQAKFKNYGILFQALSEIKKSSPELAEKLMFHITLDKNSRSIISEIEKLQISNNVDLLGTIPYEDVISYYNSVNLLVFPSYIETFGLPLIEAAYLGLPILAADLDYAHEALNSYRGVTFVQFDNSKIWANEIMKLLKSDQRTESFKEKPLYNSWGKMLELSQTIIK